MAMEVMTVFAPWRTTHIDVVVVARHDDLVMSMVVIIVVVVVAGFRGR